MLKARCCTEANLNGQLCLSDVNVIKDKRGIYKPSDVKRHFNELAAVFPHDNLHLQISNEQNFKIVNGRPLTRRLAISIFAINLPFIILSLFSSIALLPVFS